MGETFAPVKCIDNGCGRKSAEFISGSESELLEEDKEEIF